MSDDASLVDDAFVERVPFPALGIGPDGSILAVNDPLVALIEWREVELLGEPVSFVSDRSLEDWRAVLDAATAGAEPTPRDLAIRTASGISLRVRAHALPTAVDADSVVVVLQDVTADWERDCELELLRRVLRHNIRNRVNVVQGYAEQFADRIDDERAEAKLADLLEATHGIARASDKATDLRRVFDADRTLVDVDLTTTAEAAATHVRDRFPDADVSCSVPEEATAKALPVIDLAVRNLVTNAVEHNDAPTPTVNIAVTTMFEMGQGTVAIDVSDDGPPIPEMELRTLERGTEDSLNHSSGLGLWIAQWVVVRSNGKLVYEQDDGAGNTVRILLPRAPGGTPDVP